MQILVEWWRGTLVWGRLCSWSKKSHIRLWSCERQPLGLPRPCQDSVCFRAQCIRILEWRNVAARETTSSWSYREAECILASESRSSDLVSIPQLLLVYLLWQLLVLSSPGMQDVAFAVALLALTWRTAQNSISPRRSMVRTDYCSQTQTNDRGRQHLCSYSTSIPRPFRKDPGHNIYQPSKHNSGYQGDESVIIR